MGVACGQVVHGLPTKCSACCACDNVAAKGAIVKAVSSTAAADVESDLTSDVGSKSTGASRPPKLPSTAVARRSRSRPDASVHLMRDGEQRHSFEMTGSTDTLSTRETSQTPQSSGRPGSQSPAARHLWYSFSASEEDGSGSNRPITSKPPASFMSASCEEFDPEAESPTFAPSKAGRRKLVALRAASRENSTEKTPGAACSSDAAEEPAAAAEPLSDPVSMDRIISRGSLAFSEDQKERDEQEKEEEAVAPMQRPKKLFTHDFAIVRTVSRQGWDMIGQQPFQAKHFAEQDLADWTPVNTGQLLGFASQKGGQPRVPCQDEYAVLHEAGHQIYLVVDGHGECGEVVAKFARRWLVNALQILVRERSGRVLANGELTGLFADLHLAALKEDRVVKDAFRNSGCTATVAVLTPTRSLRGAWIGDCQCLAGRRHVEQPKRNSEEATRELAPPHKGPTNGLPVPVTRAIGFFAHEGLGHEAEEFIEADVDHAELEFVVLGTGGLWRGLSKVRVLDEIAKAGPYFAQHACNRVAMMSQDNQMIMAEPKVGPAAVQDATMIVVWVGGNISASAVKKQ